MLDRRSWAAFPSGQALQQGRQPAATTAIWRAQELQMRQKPQRWPCTARAAAAGRCGTLRRRSSACGRGRDCRRKRAGWQSNGCVQANTSCKTGG